MTARALVVRGGWEGHHPHQTTEAFIPFLRQSGFDIEISDALEVYTDADLLASCDLIVHCWTQGDILPDEFAGLRAAVAAGTGLAGWHGGFLDSFRQMVEYSHLVGGTFVGHPHSFVEHSVEITKAGREHEITAGMDDFTLTTEQYWVLHDSLNEVLATTTLAPSPTDAWPAPYASPVAWTRRWGHGRIFACTIGHSTDEFEVPQVRTLIERGLLWAARGGATRADDGASYSYAPPSARHPNDIA